MVTLKEMADGYIEQVRFRVAQSEQQLNELKQHLQECENEIQFGKGREAIRQEAPTTKESCCKSTDCENESTDSAKDEQ